MTRPEALRRAWRDLASGLWPGETDHAASLEAIRPGLPGRALAQSWRGPGGIIPPGGWGFGGRGGAAYETEKIVR